MFFAKKLVLVGLGAAGALFLTNAVWSGSVSTAWKKARTCVERQISPEFEIERIRDQIARLTPDMNRHIEKIAEATVECASLNRRIELVQNELDKRQKDILVRTEMIEKGIVPVGYTPGNVKERVSRDLKSYKSCERDLAAKQKMLEAKKTTLEAARSQLREIQTSRSTLEAQVAELEAELTLVNAAKAESKFVFDDSRLGTIKSDIDKLRQTVAKEREMLELSAQFLKDPNADLKLEPAKDVVTEVHAHFGTKTDSAKKD